MISLTKGPWGRCILSIHRDTHVLATARALPQAAVERNRRRYGTILVIGECRLVFLPHCALFGIDTSTTVAPGTKCANNI